MIDLASTYRLYRHMGDYAGASLDPASLIAAFEAQLDAKLDETLGPMLESGGVLDPATARAIARQTMLDRFREGAPRRLHSSLR